MDGRTDLHTDVPTDEHFRPPLMLLGRLGGVDLINVIKPDILDHKHLCKFLLLNSYIDAEATDIEMTFKIR